MFNVMVTLSPELKILPKPLTLIVLVIPTGLPSGTVWEMLLLYVVMRLADALAAANNPVTVKTPKYFVFMKVTGWGSMFNQYCRSR
jgi:hypothetical protein